MTQGGEWIKLPNIDKDCFGCGPDNIHGLRMTFETNGKKLKSTLKIPEHLRGWNNIVHGGVISTIADEIMAWAAIRLLKRFILTKTMTIRFLKPVFIGSVLTAQGMIKEVLDPKTVIMACEIYNGQQDLVATATGTFALFTTDEFRKFKLVPDPLINEMEGIFS